MVGAPLRPLWPSKRGHEGRSGGVCPTSEGFSSPPWTPSLLASGWPWSKDLNGSSGSSGAGSPSQLRDYVPPLTPMDRVNAYLDSTKKLLASRKRSRSARSRGMLYRLNRWAHLVHMVRWVRENFFSRSGCTLDLVAGFLLRLGKVWVTRGTAFAISWCKDGRQTFLRALADPGSEDSRRRLLRLSKSFSLPLGKTDLHKVSKVYLRLYLTALVILRGEKLALNVDLSPITSPSTMVEGALDRLRYHIPGFWKELKKLSPNLKQPSWWQSYHFTTKKGPSAGQAMMEAWSNFLALPDSLWESITYLGGPRLKSRMGNLRREQDNLTEFLGTTASKFLRRLVAIHDKEGKTRVIAILDYWSQTALYPLHSWIFDILKKIPQDMTFNQGRFKDIVLKWDPSGVKTKKFSVDLTQATDRFPMSLLFMVLAGFLPKRKVEAWKDIMVGYPFSYSGADVHYSVGNPMGAYSSWASFALAHHFVVYVACRQACTPWSRAKYVLLGDDILIGDRRVARKYLKILKELGVEVSVAKTFESYTLCEFAKRLLYLGEEVSPFPISAISDRPWSIPTAVSSIIGERKKGFEPIHGIPRAVRSLHECAFSYVPERRLESVRMDAFLCEQGTYLLSGKISASEFVLTVSGDPNLRAEGEWGHAERLVTTALVLQFQRSLKGQLKAHALWAEWKAGHKRSYYLLRAFQKKRPHLGNKAAWHDLSWPEFVDSFPVTHCMMGLNGVIFELENNKDTTNLDPDAWRALVRGMHNPFSDEAFGLTEETRRARVSHRLGLLVRRLVQKPEKYSSLLTKVEDRPFSRSGVLIGHQKPDGSTSSSNWEVDLPQPFGMRVGVVFFRLLRAFRRVTRSDVLHWGAPPRSRV